MLSSGSTNRNVRSRLNQSFLVFGSGFCWSESHFWLVVNGTKTLTIRIIYLQKNYRMSVLWFGLDFISFLKIPILVSSYLKKYLYFSRFRSRFEFWKPLLVVNGTETLSTRYISQIELLVFIRYYRILSMV